MPPWGFGDDSQDAGRRDQLSGAVPSQRDDQGGVVSEKHPERVLGQDVLAVGCRGLEVPQDEDCIPVADVGVPDLAAGGLGDAVVVHDHLRWKLGRVDAGHELRSQLLGHQVRGELADVADTWKSLDDDRAPERRPALISDEACHSRRTPVKWKSCGTRPCGPRESISGARGIRWVFRKSCKRSGVCTSRRKRIS